MSRVAANIRLKRAYERPAATDGVRILIDRLWPRGVRKADAAIDEWAKDLAPSTALRKWFGHDPARWDEFRRRYAREVRGHADELDPADEIEDHRQPRQRYRADTPEPGRLATGEFEDVRERSGTRSRGEYHHRLNSFCV